MLSKRSSCVNSLLIGRISKESLMLFVAGFPSVLYAIGAPAGSEWPEGASVAASLKLSATIGADGRPKLAGELSIKNTGGIAVKIQEPTNRLVLAFFVLDSLGNVVAPRGLGKVDPQFTEIPLEPGATHTHHFEALTFVTGSALFGYDLPRGKSFRVVAVYRPAGMGGPGFTSQEVKLQIPP